MVAKTLKKRSTVSRRTLSPMSEARHQTALVKWARLNNIRLVHVPNEGKREPRLGFILKNMGLAKGFPDLFLPRASFPYHGLFMEMKQERIYKPSEKLTETWINQEGWIKYLNEQFYYATFVFGWENGMKIIELYLNGEL